MAGMYGRYPNTYQEKKGRLSSIGDITEDVDESRPISDNLEPPAADTQTPVDEPKPNLTGTEEPAAQKPSWLSKAWGGIKDTFRAPVDAPKDEEGNLTGAPAVKEGMGHKILRYALPAMASFGAGQGIAPGLMAGMIGSGQTRTDNMKNELDFNKDNIAKKKAQASLLADAEKQKETARHNQATEGIGRTKANKIGKQKDDITSPDEVAAFQGLPKQYQDALSQMTLAELIKAKADPDPIKAKAASYMYKGLKKPAESQFIIGE